LLECVVSIISAKTKTDSVKAIGKVTVTYLDKEYKGKMLMTSRVAQNSEGDFEGPAVFVVRFVLSDGTKVTYEFRGSLIVVAENGVIQAFKVNIQGMYGEVPEFKAVGNTVYINMSLQFDAEISIKLAGTLRCWVQIDGVEIR
jgi:hypothetical protein